MRSKMTALLLMGLSVFLLLTAIVVAVWRFGGNAGDKRADRQSQTADSAETAETVDDGEIEEEKLTPAEEALRDRENPTIPLQQTPVDSAYFDDAAFVVNSVSRGLDLYDYQVLLIKADFYGNEDLSVYDAGNYIADMEGKTYGKIYLGLGLEEIGDDIEDIRSGYENLLTGLRTRMPDSIIILMSMPPVSEYRSKSDEYCNRELVVEYNEMLLSLADTWDVWYLDVYSVLANEEGYLPSEVNEDGIHFTPAHFTNWFETLRTHYVNDGSVAVETPAPELSPAPEGESLPEDSGTDGE